MIELFCVEHVAVVIHETSVLESPDDQYPMALILGQSCVSVLPAVIVRPELFPMLRQESEFQEHFHVLGIGIRDFHLHFKLLARRGS